MAPADSKTPDRSPVGGLAFFSSLFFLSFLAALNISELPRLWFGDVGSQLGFFALGCAPGIFVAFYVLQGKYNVLVHEFKHSLISGLVGNRWRGMKVSKESGQFTYAYSKHTAAYNAFIALAPYWVPLFTFLSLLLALALWRHQPHTLAVVVGVGFGIDLVMNTRDIGPHQTDFTLIRGGFPIGLVYVVAMNLCLHSFLAAWLMQGVPGLVFLVKNLWQFLLAVVFYFRGIK